MSILAAVAVICATSVSTGDRSCQTALYTGIIPGMARCEAQAAKAVTAAGKVVAAASDASNVVTSSFCIPAEEREDFLLVAHSVTRDSMGAKFVTVVEYTFDGHEFVKFAEHKELK